MFILRGLSLASNKCVKAIDNAIIKSYFGTWCEGGFFICGPVLNSFGLSVLTIDLVL